jgi:hypothetical protein
MCSLLDRHQNQMQQSGSEQQQPGAWVSLVSSQDHLEQTKDKGAATGSLVGQ